MPYLFTCPHCQTKTRVDDRYSGQSGECVTCGQAIRLPEFRDDAGDVTATTRKADAKVFRTIAAIAVSCILLGCLLLAVIRSGGRTMGRLAANRQQTGSIDNLRKIAEAMNAYAADHGTYPPPVSRDDAGTPLHSWRVLILPYLGEEALYNQFDLKKPWDDPINMQASYEMPAVYRHPNGASVGAYNVSGYYLITGRGTLFPAKGPLGPSDVADGPDQTVLVIEAVPVVASGFWTEPVDLDFSVMQGSPGASLGIEPGGLLDDGVAFCTVDGRGHFVTNAIDPIVFRALVTPSGGERLPDYTLD